MPTITIAGVVIDAQSKQPLSNMRIEAWDNDIKLSDVVGSFLTDEKGRFSIAYDELRFRENPKDKWADIYFKVYNGNNLVADSRNTQLLKNLSRDRLDITVVVDTRNISMDMCTVQGRVLSNRNTSYARLRVIIYDKDLRSEQKLAVTVPDENGHYLAEYSMEKAANAEKVTADLLVKVIDAGEKVIGQSGIKFNASYHEIIDVTISNELYRGLSDLETVTSLVTPLLDKLNPEDLTENEKNTDISFLSAELEIGAAILESFAGAHKLNKAASLDVAFYFALLNQDIPSKNLLLTGIDLKKAGPYAGFVYLQPEPVLTALFRIDLLQIQTAISTAADKNIIPAISDKLLKSWMNQWQEIRNKRPGNGGTSPAILTSILSIAGIPAANQKIFLEEYSRATDIGLDFWNKLSGNKKMDAAGTEKVKAVYELAAYTNHDMETTAFVAKKYKIQNRSALRKLSSLDRKEWETVLKNNSGRGKKAGAEAGKIVKRFEKEFPTAAFAANASRNKKNNPAAASVQKLHEAFPDAELHKMNVVQFVNANHSKLKVAKKEKDAFVNDLMKVQRVFKIAPQYEATQTLLDNDIHSAAAIYSLGEDNFSELLTQKAGVSKEEAAQMYQKAETTHALSIALAGDLHSITTGGVLNVLPSMSMDAMEAALLKEFPDMQGLFGSADMCECQHCRSVYSAAAYLVDVLQYLDKRRSTTSGQSVKDVLFKRRADMGETELTCENTNTPMPFIDLVCEILEDAVADNSWPLPGTIGAQLAISPISSTLKTAITGNSLAITQEATVQPGKDANEWIVRDNLNCYKITKTGAQYRIRVSRQTHLSAEELKARPEYINNEAYKTLNQNKYPFALPFDLSWHTANGYIKALEADRYQLMGIFRTAGNPSDLEMAYQYLQLPKAAGDIITGVTAGTINDFWGNITDINKVNTFLTKTGLDYKQMLQLFECKFINPAGTDMISIPAGASKCDASIQTITGLTNAVLLKMHRFIRLWQVLGWQFWELDMVVMSPSFETGSINTNFILKLQQLVWLQRTLKRSVEEVVVLLDGFSKATLPESLVTGRRPLYHKLFLDKAMFDPLDKAFYPENILQGTPAELPGITETLSAHSGVIMAALKLSAEEFTVLENATVNKKLSINNLNFLSRYSVLARGLKMSITDLFTLIELHSSVLPLSINNPKNPFTNIASLNSFCTTVQQLQGLPFKVNDLNYLFAHRNSVAEAAAISQQVTTHIEAVRKALTGIDKDLAVDATGSARDWVKIKLAALPSFDEKAVNDLIKIVDQNGAPALTAPQKAQLGVWLNGIIPLTGAAGLESKLDEVAPADEDIRLAGKYQFIKDALIVYQKALQYREQLVSVTATAYKISEKAAASFLDALQVTVNIPLLNQFLADPDIKSALPVNEANFATLFKAGRLLQKSAFITNALSLTQQQVDFILANSTAAGLPGFNELPLVATAPFAFIQKLVTLGSFILLNKKYPGSEDLNFVTCLNEAYSAAGTLNNWNNLVVELTGWNPTVLQNTQAYFGFAFPADHKNLSKLDTLDAAMEYLLLLKTSATDVAKLIKPQLTADDALVAENIVKSQFDKETWFTVSGDVQSPIRQLKRNALTQYLINNPPAGESWNNSNDLYSWYLIDTEMGSCEVTTRILQAGLSVQLFVQRCLMQLELEVIADADTDRKWLQWKWMKNYRVWEANRKVFLYPENYLEPELRPDKSIFFKELENDLMQNEINDENVETGYLNYLEKLDNVARLNVCGTYYDENTLIFHVFAHTYDEPRIYYYRKWVKDRYWTPWEKVTADIQSDQLIPVIRNSRLYIYWPEFNEVNEEPSSSELTPPKPNGSGNYAPSKTATKYTEIRLAMCEFKNKKWSAKKLSKSKIDTRNLPGGANHYSKENFVFVPIIDSLRSVLDFVYMFMNNSSAAATDGIEEFLESFGITNQNVLVCLYETGDHHEFHTGNQAQPQWTMQYVNTFELGSCHGTPEIADSFTSYITSNPRVPYFDKSGYYDGEDREVLMPEGTPDSLVFHQWGVFPFINHAPLINKTPGSFRTQFSLQLSLADKFFYAISTMIGRGLWLYMKGDLRSEYALPYSTSTFLPFFYEDRSRTFMVQPEMLITSVDPNDPEKTTADEFFYSDMLQMIRDFAASHDIPEQLKKYMQEGIRYSLRPAMRFRNFYHPLVCFFMKQVYTNGLEGLLNRDIQLVGDLSINDAALQEKVRNKFREVKLFDFKKVYDPSPLINPYNYPEEEVDFSPEGSYAQYNWELFFHGPMYVAGKLGSNQKFEEAMKWYHYIFNPTDTSSYPNPQKFWITKPFFLRSSAAPGNEYLKQRIDQILGMIHNNDVELLKQVSDWKDNPFQPHLVAQFRTVAYQKSVVMKYIDNLISWGDNLFRQNTREALGQATQMYILAAEILGPKPKVIPNRNGKTPKSYNQVKPGLDGFSNAVIQLENVIPSVPETAPGSPAPPPPPLPAIETFYFCLPINEKLLGYWDKISLRLFNLRNCLTIDGDPRSNALFDPPIDPAMLVKAVASGVDLQDALSDMNAPLPYYRFSIMLQKAKEFNNEVKALGAAIMGALEKKDGEALSLLRSTNEMKVLNASIALRKYSIQDAKLGLEGLKQNKKNAELRIKYYGGQLYMNPLETTAFTISTASTIVHTIGSIADVLAGALALIPQFNGGASGFGGSPHVTVSYGSEQISKAAELGAKVMYQTSAIMDKAAGLVSTQAGYVRRKDEWDFQRKQAENDLQQIIKQMASSEIKIKMAEKELANQELQIENAQQTDDFMRSKFTNIELYNWMITQLSGVYFQSYKLALDMAKKAEKCFRYELAAENTGFIQPGYWDSLYKGLQSAEKLAFDLNKMDASYMDQNKREHEMTKTISLSLLDPLSLISLKETGKCEVFIPESLFDMDCPGHYLRRIKSVSVSIPCIAGPYTSVNCKMTLMSSMVRKNTTPGGGYFRDAMNEDARFVYNYGVVQSVITSNAQNDTGLFETNLKDERYLPFEGQGVISRWKIELLQLESGGVHIRNFDFSTVSDVLLQMRYTARYGGDPFRKTVNDAITGSMNSIIEYATAAKNKFYRVIPLKHELATEWHRLFNPPQPAGDQELLLSLTNEWFPFFMKEKNLQVDDVHIYVKYKKGIVATPFRFSFELATAAAPPALGVPSDELGMKKYARNGLNNAIPANLPLNYKLIGWKQAGAVHSRFTANDIEDIVLAVHYEVL